MKLLRLLPLLVIPFAASLIGCIREPSAFVATSGQREGAEGARTALRASAQYDLVCADKDLRDYDLTLGSHYTGGRYPTHQTLRVQVVEGCGKRALYKASCEEEVPVRKGASPEEAERRREWALSARDEASALPIVCRYLLLSRVSLDPSSAGVATDSVATAPSTAWASQLP